jgi:outer membrane protein TolC
VPDPQLNLNSGVSIRRTPLKSSAHWRSFVANKYWTVQCEFSQAFATGSSFVQFDNNQTPTEFYQSVPCVELFLSNHIRQELRLDSVLARRRAICRSRKTTKKISDIAFRDQVIATITQIKNIYWDLVNAYEQARVNEQS